MIVKLLTSLSGIDYNFAHGTVVDFPDDQAQRFIDADLAEASNGPVTAVLPTPEDSQASAPAAGSEALPPASAAGSEALPPASAAGSEALPPASAAGSEALPPASAAGSEALPPASAAGSEALPNTPTVDLTKLTKQQIVDHAMEVHGLELDPTDKKADLIAAVDEHLQNAGA